MSIAMRGNNRTHKTIASRLAWATTLALGLACVNGCDSGPAEEPVKMVADAPAPPEPEAPGTAPEKTPAAGTPANTAATNAAPTATNETAAPAAAAPAAPAAIPAVAANGGGGTMRSRLGGGQAQVAKQAPAEDDGSSEKATVGAGVKGRDYGGPGLVTTPVEAYFRTGDRIAFEIQIPNAMKLYKAEHNNKGPKTQEEFMNIIIKENGVQLPELPAGDEYWYDPKTAELMVRHPKPEGATP